MRTPITLALIIGLLGSLAGCISPSERLKFPAQPIDRAADRVAYDTDHDGRADFTIRADPASPAGRLDVLAYDDDDDGTDDRVYRLSDYNAADVPHFIILLDSIPYEPLAERFRSAHWSWFDPPQKVIPPFPTMSGVIFSAMLHAPPLPGMINQYYDRNTGAQVDRLWQRTQGDKNPWERRLHYRLKYWENGLSFLKPREWFRTELARAKKAFDDSPDRVTIVYFASTAGMLSQLGAAGCSEILDGVEQLCGSVLHDRNGAVKISVIADHGHNFIAGSRIDLPDILRDHGFKPADRLHSARDVVIELDGLVNYAGLYTRQPAPVADALSAHPEIELALYLDGERVMIRGASGRARIERRPGSDPSQAAFRYRPIDADVLNYNPIIDQLRAAGKLDADGFALDADWFDATIDHRWPDAPHRLWHAFHGIAVSTPDVMITTAPGYFVGLPSMEWFITMASTHGGLDQIDSATFVLTMTGRAARPMRTSEVIPTIEPTFNPDHKPR